MSSANTARRFFAEIYKNEQTKILRAQQSLVQDAIAFVQILKWPSKDTTAQKIKFAQKILESKDSFMNAIKLRRYIRQLIAVATSAKVSDESSGEEDSQY